MNATPEDAGTVIWRQSVGFFGQDLPAGDVLVVDVPFPSGGSSGPFRFEHEIAVFKPLLDVVIVGADIAHLALPPVPLPIPPTPYGTITITRVAGGASGPIARNFDWVPRDEEGGTRIALAGDAGGFNPINDQLPDLYDNAFCNGNPVAGQGPLVQGDRVDFSPDAGAARSVTIPAPPRFEATQDAAPLNPAVALVPRVDTVVLDLVANAFVLVWRAVFPWETRFENATLEVFNA